MEVLNKIKRLVIRKRVIFTDKAQAEMKVDDLDEDQVYEAIINAPAITKRIRSKNPQTGEKEYMYVILGQTFEGLAIYTKGKILRAGDLEVFMSLSRQKRPRFGNSHNRLPPLLPCPDCGAETLRKVRQNCQLRNGMVIRRLSHYQCSTCNAVFFDDAAMKEIRRQRKTQRATS